MNLNKGFIKMLFCLGFSIMFFEVGRIDIYNKVFGYSVFL